VTYRLQQSRQVAHVGTVEHFRDGTRNVMRPTKKSAAMISIILRSIGGRTTIWRA
jgi:hypothetical protein